MKRTVISVITLIITIAVATAGFIINNNTTSMITDSLDEAIEICSKGDTKKADELIGSVIDSWSDMSKTIMIFSSHDKADEVDMSLRIAQSYAQSGDSKLFIAECRKAKLLLNQINELEYPRLHNVL